MGIDWVAEIGSAHKGSKSLCYELIREFSQAGATICKFQMGHSKIGPDIYGNIDAHSFKHIDDWAPDLTEWCKKWGVEFMASIWTDEALDMALDVGMERLKIAHQIALDKKKKRLVRRILATGRPVFLSGALNLGYASGDPHYIYVQPEYPVFAPRMPMEFGGMWWYGYSSHAHGIGDALIAIARGAKYIEKHVTLDKTDESVRDNSFALYPEEFAQMVRIGNEMERVL